MRILVITPRELTRDVRARREVEAAQALGHDVVGLSARLAEETPAPLPGVEVARVGGGLASGRLRRAGLGGMTASPPLVRELRGLWRLGRLGKTTLKLVLAGLRLGRFDVVHANDLDALPAGWLLARRSGALLVYDAHELYSVMEHDPPRAYWAIVARIEGMLGRRATVVTNCDPFAAELEQSLRLPSPPVVVLNCPDLVAELAVPEAPGRPVRAIYQAAGDHPGRPVRDLLAAADAAPGVEITVRVVDLDRAAFAAEAGGRVRVVDPVPVAELVTGLAGYDVGVVINRPVTPNDELAVPGKIFEYMMAGMAVVAPRLGGMAELIEGEEIGLTFEAGDPGDLGRALAELAADPERLTAMRVRARTLAVERFNSAAQVASLERAWTRSAAAA
jgi:glycosyltransferase involved in cell wall biosynthesis